MGSGKMAGEDGIPAEWYKTMGARVTKSVYKDEIDRDATPIDGQYPSALAHLMSDAYTQVHKDGEAPTGMRTAIISLLYKEKGERFNLQNYRPIAVGNAVGKILEKCMEIRIRPLLPHLISPEQKAFQPNKNILENTQLVQDVIAYCNENNISGMIKFCDQDNAYPRVE